MIVDILAIVDGGAGQLVNGAIDFADGFTFVRGHSGVTRSMFEHPSRRTQIRDRVQVSRVFRGLRSASDEKQRHQQKSAMQDRRGFRFHCISHDVMRDTQAQSLRTTRRQRLCGKGPYAVSRMSYGFQQSDPKREMAMGRAAILKASLSDCSDAEILKYINMLDGGQGGYVIDS
jgi:hypothetical protein